MENLKEPGSIEALAKKLKALSVNDLQAMILDACKKDTTQSTTTHFFTEALKSTLKSPEGPAQDSSVASQDAETVNSIKRMLKDNNKELATLSYMVCRIGDVAVPAEMSSTAYSAVIAQFENSRDRERVLQQFARGTHRVISRANETLNPTQEVLVSDFQPPAEQQVSQLPPSQPPTPTPSPKRRSPAVWRGVNDPRWDRFNNPA
ncbi:hypothetical protein F4819DRAFT_56462 [Hypoxylon fuscum]|nr:hypothetical protein F4819DRAFT_56462 [Hypoxylon fuscum]